MSQSPLTVIVTSAVELSKEQLDTLGTAIKKKHGAKALEIENRIDPHVLGGFKLTINSIELDATLQTKLNKLKYQLKETV